MNTPATIQKIKTARSTIIGKLSSVAWKDKDFTCGSENEYNAKSLLGGIRSLMMDINMLTKAPAQFIKLSTYQERNAISQTLTHIENNLNQPNNNLANQIEQLKIQLRPYCTRTRKEWFEEVGNSSDTLIKKQVDLESSLTDCAKSLQEAQELRNSLQEVYSTFEEEKDEASKLIDGKLEALSTKQEVQDEKLDKLDTEIENFEDRLANLQDTEEKVENILETVNTSQIEVSSNEKLINSFAKKVTEREKAFDSLIEKTDQNSDQLESFQVERESYLKEVQELIDSAKQALEYKTAEGLSAAFSSEKSSYEGSSKLLWLIFSGISLIGALALGIWISVDKPDALSVLIGRLALIPLPLASAWFCARQYVKVANIWVDYGYKMTLAKSLVGFSEELKKHAGDSEEEYRHYIKTVLEQILQDPLRSRSKSKEKTANTDTSQSPEKILDVAEKIIKITKGNVE